MSQSPDQLKEEGLQQFQRKAYGEALRLFKTAVSLYTSQNNQPAQAEMLNNIGVIYRMQHNYDDAIVALQEAEAIFAGLSALEQQGQTLGNLGDLFAAKKDKQEAARCYSDASELLAAANALPQQGQVLRAFSLMRLRQGQWLEAITLMEQSLTVRPRLGVGNYLLRSLLRFGLGLIRGK